MDQEELDRKIEAQKKRLEKRKTEEERKKEQEVESLRQAYLKRRESTKHFRYGSKPV